jgi:hypothetical protein
MPLPYLPFAKSVILVSVRISGLGSGSMSPADLYNLALNAGFPSTTAVQMAAIAMKESGGNPGAYNGTPPDDSYGLWQINMYGNLGPSRMSQFGLTDKSQLFDPATNARAAYQIWGGNDSNLNIAWAINDGGTNQSRYQANLPIVQAAIGAAPSDLGPIDASSFLASLNPNSPGFSPGALGAVAIGSLFGILLLSRS